MADLSALLERIDAEFNASQEKIKKVQTQKLEEHKGREARLEKFGRLSEQLRDVWKPKLEALGKRFGERAGETPAVTAPRRGAAFKFRSPLARLDARSSSGHAP